MSSAEAASVFTPLPADAAADLSPDQASALAKIQALPTTVSVQLVTADAAALGDSADIGLPDGSTVTATRQDSTVKAADNFTWTGGWGTIDQAVFVAHDGNITGAIHNGGDRYSVTPIGGGVHAFVKVNMAAFPEDDPGRPNPNGGDATSAAGTTSADTPVVDVLVAYTTNARLAYAGDIRDLAAASVADSNTTYQNSGANVRQALVATAETSYNEVGLTFDQVLDDLTTGGALASLRNTRNQVGADVTVLLIVNQALCGLAWLVADANTAYAVVAYNCAVDNHSFVHEVGHNFGAQHDVNNASDPPGTLPYSHGTIHPSNLAASDSWRTVMSYATGNGCAASFFPCVRIGYLSTPNLQINGAPLGDATVRDNTRVHSERAATMASFRSAGGGGGGTVAFGPIALLGLGAIAVAGARFRRRKAA